MSFPRYPTYKDSGVQLLGAVPGHWELKRFKRIFQEREERSQHGAELLLSVSAYTGVTPRSEVIDDGDHLSRAESLEGYKICFKNDLVINIMLAWNRGLAFTEHDGIVSPAYCVFTVIDGSTPRFLNYLVRSDEYTLYFKAFSAGVIDSRLRIYPDTFGRLFCALPPLTEQSEIAAFLDCETAKIDGLVAEQRRLMALLKEKRQVVISHVVTRGLNPDAPMKPSGIEWLGDVPAHWEVSPLRRLASKGTSITYGIVQAGPDIEDGIPYIRTSDMSGDSLAETGYMRTTSEIDASYARSKVKPNDLVVAIRASLGKGLLVPDFLDGANLTQGTARISPGENLMPKFLLWAFNSSYCQTSIRVVAKGTTFLEITLDALRRIQLAAPPLVEQVAIVAHLDQVVGQLDTLTAEAQRAIDLLQERRTALISAAVTGQIDVRQLTAKEAA